MSPSVVWRFHRAARRYGAEVDRIVGTAVLRLAGNRAALSTRLEQTVGLPLQVLSGEEEATAGFRAVGAIYARPERVLGTIDIGGGSTELTATSGVRLLPDAVLSVPVGGRTLLHRFGLHLATPDATWAATTADLAYTVGQPAAALRPRPTFGVILGGAGDVLAHMRLQAHAQRLARGTPIEGAGFSRPWLETAADQLRRLDAEGRATVPGVAPDLADIIAGGAAILLAILHAWDLSEIAVTELNILDGLASE